jgi:glycosyltransferase involved in cell wall biosynthesis
VYEHVAPYYEKVHVIPIAIDLSRFQPVYPDAAKSRLLVIHAPTNPEFKGTAYVEQAVRELQRDIDFEYRRVEHMNHDQAVRLYQDADIIVDQVRCGSYGLLSVEAMALGKPVVAYIRDDLKALFPPGLPIYNANPDNLRERLRELLTNPALRLELGLKGRKYVENHHAKEVAVDRLEQIYAGL